MRHCIAAVTIGLLAWAGTSRAADEPDKPAVKEKPAVTKDAPAKEKAATDQPVKKPAPDADKDKSDVKKDAPAKEKVAEKKEAPAKEKVAAEKKEPPKEKTATGQPVKKPAPNADAKKPTADDKQRVKKEQAAGGMQKGRLEKAEVVDDALRLTIDGKVHELAIGAGTLAVVKSTERDGKETVVGVQLMNVDDGGQKRAEGKEQLRKQKEGAVVEKDAPKKPADKSPEKQPEKKPE